MSSEDTTGEGRSIFTDRAISYHSTLNRGRAIFSCKSMLKVYKMIKNMHGVNVSKLYPILSGAIDLLLFDDTDTEV